MSHPALARTSDSPAPENKGEKSVGEKMWHRVTYTGMGYLSTAAISVVLWDYFISGNGKAVYDGVKKYSRSALEGGGVSPSKASALSESIAKYTFSPMGGHLITVPMKLLEDKSRLITHKFNQQFDPNYEHRHLHANLSTPSSQLPPLVDPPNKNNWGQIAARRGLSWGAVVASGAALRAIGAEQPVEDAGAKAVAFAAENSGIKSLQRFAKTDKFARWARLVPLEFTLTIVTAGVFAVTKNMFGGRPEHHLTSTEKDYDSPTENDENQELGHFTRQVSRQDRKSAAQASI